MAAEFSGKVVGGTFVEVSGDTEELRWSTTAEETEEGGLHARSKAFRSALLPGSFL